MKKIILFLGVLLFSNIAMAQQYTSVSTNEKKHLVEVEDGLYKVLITSDESKLRQVGFYKEHIGGTLVKDGIWKMYDDGDLLVTASFKDNKLVWIKPKDEKKYTSEEIQKHRSQRRLESLANN